MRALNFDVRDHVFLKVSQMKGLLRFGKKGKLSLHFIGLFEILEKVGMIVYWITLPPRYD